jgi:Cytochrome c3
MPRFHRIFLRIEKALQVALAATICASTSLGALLQTGSGTGMSLPTEVRVKHPGWWPTKGEPAREEYVGSETCATCHASIAASYRMTAMARAAAPAPSSDGLHQHNHLFFRLGPFSYEILTSSARSLLSVSDAVSSLSETLTWAFGEGHIGQTYVYEKAGNFFEGHVSFFTSLQALDITPGQRSPTPASLEDAAGRRMNASETRLCFGCHTTAATVNQQFDPQSSIPGVGCESCHGPGERHVADMTWSMEETADARLLNPRQLNPAESVDFCGACHRTWQDVVQSGGVALGVLNVRFAPYRLENSRCWMNGDARITCTACHDPHKRLVTDRASYDPVCLRCHILSSAKERPDHPGGACPVADTSCVTCHMPKYEPPGFHASFTDHWIRVARPGPSYPN